MFRAIDELARRWLASDLVQSFEGEERIRLARLLVSESFVSECLNRLMFLNFEDKTIARRPSPPEAIAIAEQFLKDEDNASAFIVLWDSHKEQDLPENPASGNKFKSLLLHGEVMSRATADNVVITEGHAGRWLHLLSELLRQSGYFFRLRFSKDCEPYYGKLLGLLFEQSHIERFIKSAEKLPSGDANIIFTEHPPGLLVELPPRQVLPEGSEIDLAAGDYLAQARRLRAILDPMLDRVERADLERRAFETSIKRRIPEAEARLILERLSDREKRETRDQIQALKRAARPSAEHRK